MALVINTLYAGHGLVCSRSHQGALVVLRKSAAVVKLLSICPRPSALPEE